VTLARFILMTKAHKRAYSVRRRGNHYRQVVTMERMMSTLPNPFKKDESWTAGW